MSDQFRWVLGGTLTLVGVLMVVAGWILDDRTYLSSLLLQVGSTMLLAVPLLLIERVLEKRVRGVEEVAERRVGEVRSEVQSVSRSVSELQSALDQRLGRAESLDEQIVEDARSNVSFETVHKALRRASELGALSKDGVRVPLPHLWERIRFVLPEADASEIRVSIEDTRGIPMGPYVKWTADLGPTDLLAQLAEAWLKTGDYPGNSAIDANAIFTGLLDTLALGIEGRRNRGGGQLSPLIEVISPDWAMTDYGLEHLTFPEYAIPASELATDAGLEEWRGHMREKIWVDENNETAKRAGHDDFWMVSQRAHLLFRDTPSP